MLNKVAFLHHCHLTSFSLPCYTLPSRIAIKVFTFNRALTGTFFFNRRRFNAKTNVSDILIRDLLFADDCALVAYNIDRGYSVHYGLLFKICMTFSAHCKSQEVRSLVPTNTRVSYTPPVVKV